MILLHYTGMQDPNAALALLTSSGSEVSAHYFVFEDGRVVQMVEESRRAWHAGVSYWAGETDINSCSIGIEIANPGHDYGYPDFPARQIAAVTALCRGILTRHTIPRRARPCSFRCCACAQAGSGREISVAHAARFRRGSLGQAGAADRGRSDAHARRSRCRGRRRCRLRCGNTATASPPTAFSTIATHEVVTAFQRHFRPQRVDGICDASTRKTLEDLLAHRGRPRNIAARARALERLAAS